MARNRGPDVATLVVVALHKRRAFSFESGFAYMVSDDRSSSHYCWPDHRSPGYKGDAVVTNLELVGLRGRPFSRIGTRWSGVWKSRRLFVWDNVGFGKSTFRRWISARARFKDVAQ